MRRHRDREAETGQGRHGEWCVGEGLRDRGVGGLQHCFWGPSETPAQTGIGWSRRDHTWGSGDSGKSQYPPEQESTEWEIIGLGDPKPKAAWDTLHLVLPLSSPLSPATLGCPSTPVQPTPSYGGKLRPRPHSKFTGQEPALGLPPPPAPSSNLDAGRTPEGQDGEFHVPRRPSSRPRLPQASQPPSPTVNTETSESARGHTAIPSRLSVWPTTKWCLP